MCSSDLISRGAHLLSVRQHTLIHSERTLKPAVSFEIPFKQSASSYPEVLKRLEQSQKPELTLDQISQKLAELYPEQELKKIISISINQVIKEIIQPIVQRNVNIALITTKELVLKDFSLEKDPKKLQEASGWVVQSLAGSLARVTSREPFRVHLVNSLNEIFKNKNVVKYYEY